MVALCKIDLVEYCWFKSSDLINYCFDNRKLFCQHIGFVIATKIAKVDTQSPFSISFFIRSL